MKLLNWNIEHMNSWWEGGNQDPPVMRDTFAGNNFSPAITDVKVQIPDTLTTLFQY